jgi:two-component system, cell cycle sensor histidine kinase and response regulator CckA
VQDNPRLQDPNLPSAPVPTLEQTDEFQQLYDEAPCGYHSLDANGVFVRVNQTELTMLGYSRAELIGHKTFFEILTPASQQIFTNNFSLFKQRGYVRDLEFQIIRKDTSTFPVSLSSTVIKDADSNYLVSRSIMIDISDRKQAEQKIREQANLLAITSDAIYVHDLENRILFWNQGAEKLYDCPADEMIDQDWRQLLSSPEALLELENTVSNQNTWQGEVTKRTQLGKKIVVMSRRSVMLDDAGNIKSILTVDTDITEKKHLESQFLRAQRLESLGMLASGIAHDLNNVLTPIIGIVQLLPLKITNLDPQIQRLLEILNDSAHRGADLVKQILSFTRGIEGKPSNVQIGHLIAETQKIIQETFPKNIDLLVDLPTDLWLASADATLLHQVFLNLCVNARDAMPKGGNLSITAENLEIDENYARMNLDAEAGSYVVVTIADTGMGIPPDIIDRIFDPFFTTKDVGKGTGLGLSTVMGVIKSHHGFISVYSEIGKGTRFKVYLPASDDSTIDPTIKNELLFGNGELILVVDDETAVQEVTKATLETHGYKTILANDGIEAIALYAENKSKISAVLLDMMMPSLDSVTIIRTLSKLNSQVQIIAMSGLATNESVTKMTNEGVKAFLAKPFTAHELLQPLALICRQNSDGAMI